MSPRKSTPTELDHRFWGRVVIGDGCWQWVGDVNNRYGRFSLGHNIPIPAHRYAYQSLVGPIPPGLEVDHLCRNTTCVSPHHLEAVTQRENTRRSDNPAGLNFRKTHCKRGHAFTPENIKRQKDGGRQCRTCFNDYLRAWTKAKRERSLAA